MAWKPPKSLWKRWLALGLITAAGVVATALLGEVRFFQLAHLKARDFHFIVRGKLPVRDIVIVTMDQKTMDEFSELLLFWHPYYAKAMYAAAAGGAKVLGLDIAFAVNVSKWEPDHDPQVVEAVAATAATMPVIISYVPGTLNKQNDPKFVVPVNMIAGAMGQAAFANLTADADDFIRTQELLEKPDPANPGSAIRGLAARVAEKFRGQELGFDNGRLIWSGRAVPTVGDRTIMINYAGPPDTFPKVSLVDVIRAADAGNQEQLKKWFSGKAVLLGPDYTEDRHPTPFYTSFSGKRWNTAGVEIHASTLRTLLEQEYLVPVSETARYGAVAAVVLMTALLVTLFPAAQAGAWLTLAIAATAAATHVLFRYGWVLSTSELLLGCLMAILGSLVYRFLTAEKKGALFQKAVSVFVGRELAASLSETGAISLSGKRQTVTILFSDIRGFTAFCESKDPGVVVDLLNEYMGTMVAVIVSWNGSVNKFIGDGILAIFSDEDPKARPGDHALRAVRCGIGIVQAPQKFKTGVGIHSGPAVVGNVGSRDKMEYTVLGDTVNLASRLESLNKEMKTSLLLSEATREMMGGDVEVVPLGSVPVRGKALPLNVYTAATLVPPKTPPAPAAEPAVEKK